MKYRPAEAFEKFSFDYIKIRQSEYNNDDQLNLLAQKMHPVLNKEILELGCGSGIPVLKKFYDLGAKVFGIDISENMIVHAKRNLPKGHFICCDMTEIDLENNEYDAILSFYALFVLEIEKQFMMFEKIFQALKPGGFTYFTLLCEAYTKKKEMAQMLEFMGHLLFFAQTTPEKYRTKLEDIGFTHIEMEELTIGQHEGERCLWVYAEKP